ncbi:MAG: hypothetical protein PHR35_02720 [Kiritimatiellae bacterium]|nr:hypothetical protein [Kiritimatiellia bacterium]
MERKRQVVATQDERKQIGGIFLSPNWIEAPALATPWLRQIADMGYRSATILVRHMKRTVLDRAVHEAIKAIVTAGHKLGLKMLLDTEHAWWAPAIVESNPEAALWGIVPVEATAHEGAFEFVVPFPRMMGHQILFEQVAAVFQPQRGGYRFLSSDRVEATAMHCAVPSNGVVLKGRVSGGVSGKLAFYVAFKTFGLADAAHPLYLKAQERLLDAYADIPLDGVTWDEPGKGFGDLSCFKAGAGFLKLFRRMNGYDLAPNLIYLDHLDGTARAVKVRCDYQRTLVEMNYVAQARHNRHAQKLFGADIGLGTHQTWCGFPADLAAGVIDYFKLGKLLTEAWTDGGWVTEPKYSAHNFMLAEGLKKELGKRNAYYNDWGMRWPAVEDMRFVNRLKMVFHVNWFNHCVSEFSENILNFTQDPLRAMAVRDVANLDRLDRLVGDAFAPHSDVALLYTWESLAASPKWLVRLFYTFIVNASMHLVDKGLFAAIMSGASLLDARIGDGCFTTRRFTYKVLLVPYARVLPKAVYRKVMAIAAAGVPVIIIGPPPEFTAEDGKAIGCDFAQRVGMKPFTFAEYASVLAEQSTLPAVNEWEPSAVDATYPVTAPRRQRVFDNEGRLLYVKAAGQPLYYMPSPDPREDLTTLVSSLAGSYAETFAEDTYYRFFAHRRDPSQMVVVAVAKGHIASVALAPDKYGQGARPPIKAHALKALFRVDGGELTLKGGAWCAVRLNQGQVVECIGDCPDVRWNGQRIIA